MGNSKLMTPLFYHGNFNREGHRMRAVLEKEISDGTQTYQLWHSAGKPEQDYPQAENDKYILYVEINGYLVTLGMTDYNLINNCGFEPAAQKLYGGKENRGTWLNAVEKSGSHEAVSAAVAEEQKEVERYGGDSARQVKYIRNLLDDHVSTYLKSKENGGQTFPDFTGALVMNELAKCVELSAVYRAKRQAEEDARRARIEAEDKAYCEEQNRLAEQTVSAAIQIIRNGGVLENTTVMFYQNRSSFHVYSLVNYLMRQYAVKVPLRTYHWISANLCSATIQDGLCSDYRYYRKKGSRGSRKFFEYMNALIQAVTTQTAEEAA